MITTLTHFLNERKQLGIIYHFTTFDNLIGILKSNSLISGYHYISFTRNRLFDDDGGIYPYELKNIKKYIIRIDIIENSLKKYKYGFEEKFNKMVEENPEIEFKLKNSFLT